MAPLLLPRLLHVLLLALLVLLASSVLPPPHRALLSLGVLLVPWRLAITACGLPAWAALTAVGAGAGCGRCPALPLLCTACLLPSQLVLGRHIRPAQHQRAWPASVMGSGVRTLGVGIAKPTLATYPQRR